MKLSLQSKISFFRLFFRILGFIPLPVRSAAGFAAGFLFSLIPARERKIAVVQLRRFLPAHADWVTIGRVYGNLGQNIMETINLNPVLSRADRFITIEGIEVGKKFFDEGRSIVCLSAHTGNWDLLAAEIIRRGFPVCTVGREARNPVFQGVLAEMRGKYGVEMLWRSGGQKQILSALRKKVVVAALIDQDTQVAGVMAPFFGEPAFTPFALGEIARRCGCGLVTAFIIRTGFLKFRVFVEEIGTAQSAEDIAAEFNRRLEALLRKYPSQWVWFHKRWRTRADGTRLSSREYLAKLQSEPAGE